jgi:hypothetical protein
MATGEGHKKSYERGTAIVREEEHGEWLVTWLPADTDDPDAPDRSLSSAEGDLPRDLTLDGVLGWIGKQSWALPKQQQ